MRWKNILVTGGAGYVGSVFIDFKVTYANAVTSQWVLGHLPIVLENDHECLVTAMKKHELDSARIVRITNTLDLEEFSVSENLVPFLKNRENIEIGGCAETIRFDAEGFVI